MITPKQKTTSLPSLIKELDTVFSLFIRLRDADERGTVTCFVTGEKVWWKDSDAAHFIAGIGYVRRILEAYNLLKNKK